MIDRAWPTDNITESQLRVIIHNATRIASASEKRRPLWALVGSAFGVGSTHATALCKRAGIDPDVPAGKLK